MKSHYLEFLLHGNNYFRVRKVRQFYETHILKSLGFIFIITVMQHEFAIC
jgi:hypothetical protein